MNMTHIRVHRVSLIPFLPYLSMYIRITSTKSPSFCMTAFSACLTIPVVFLPQSRACSYHVCRRTLIPPPLWLQKHTDLHAHDFAHSPHFGYQPSIVNVTCVWSWRLCGINPTIHLCLYSCVHPQVFRQQFYVQISYHRPFLRQILSSASNSNTPQSLFFHYVKRFTVISVRNKR